MSFVHDPVLLSNALEAIEALYGGVSEIHNVCIEMAMGVYFEYYI
jgi:hypothetical protein